MPDDAQTGERVEQTTLTNSFTQERNESKSVEEKIEANDNITYAPQPARSVNKLGLEDPNRNTPAYERMKETRAEREREARSSDSPSEASEGIERGEYSEYTSDTDISTGVNPVQESPPEAEGDLSSFENYGSGSGSESTGGSTASQSDHIPTYDNSDVADVDPTPEEHRGQVPANKGVPDTPTADELTDSLKQYRAARDNVVATRQGTASTLGDSPIETREAIESKVGAADESARRANLSAAKADLAAQRGNVDETIDHALDASTHSMNAVENGAAGTQAASLVGNVDHDDPAVPEDASAGVATAGRDLRDSKSDLDAVHNETRGVGEKAVQLRNKQLDPDVPAEDVQADAEALAEETQAVTGDVKTAVNGMQDAVDETVEARHNVVADTDMNADDAYSTTPVSPERIERDASQATETGQVTFDMPKQSNGAQTLDPPRSERLGEKDPGELTVSDFETGDVLEDRKIDANGKPLQTVPGAEKEITHIDERRDGEDPVVTLNNSEKRSASELEEQLETGETGVKEFTDETETASPSQSTTSSNDADSDSDADAGAQITF